MKRSKLVEDIEYLLYQNEKFLNYDKAERILQMLEELNIFNPTYSKSEELLKQYPEYFHNDGYHGNVCKFAWRDYGYKLPKELHQYVEVVNCGEYSIVKLAADKIKGWEPESN